jgi:aminoglycoside 6'-N-acetyltransferase I
MNVRPIRDDEFERWFEMRLALSADDFAPELLRREMDEIRSDPARQVCLVAESDDGRLVGFAEGAIRPWAVGCDSRNVGYLESWYVDPDHRRQGVGRDLVEGCRDWARNLGCVEFASDCVIENETSRRAHLALGFEERARLICFRQAL